MWLHVRALDAKRTVVFESGRYVFATATLSATAPRRSTRLRSAPPRVGDGAGHQPRRRRAVGLPAGRSFHLPQQRRLKDNRIPPRGFTNAAFDAFDGEPVGAAYADGQYWDDVAYPVGARRGRRRGDALLPDGVARVRRVPARREHHQRRRQHPLHLWDQHDESVPVAMAKLLVEREPEGRRDACRKQVAKLQAKYRKGHYKRVVALLRATARTGSPATRRRATRASPPRRRSLRERLGGLQDVACAGRNLTPSSLGHGGVCPARARASCSSTWPTSPACSICLADELDGEALDAAYGVHAARAAVGAVVGRRSPASVRSTRRLSCSRAAGARRSRAARTATQAGNCRRSTAATDPGGRIATRASTSRRRRSSRCTSFSGIPGCATAGNAAGGAGLLRERRRRRGRAVMEVAYP